MKNIFEHMGKVPYRIVFDNLSSAVAHIINLRQHSVMVLPDGKKAMLKIK